MKRRLLAVSGFLLLLTAGEIRAQSGSVNLGFELGNFTNWTGYAWIYSTDKPERSTAPKKVNLPNGRRQTIMADQLATDANTGNQLRKVPPGYRYSARLGDMIDARDTGNFRCWQQSLRYTLKVDTTNALLVLKFALVLQYADNHTARMEPRFRLKLYDERGDSIPDCANYDVFASANSIKGFHSYQPDGQSDPVRWRDWTTVGVDLSRYLGRQVTIEFMSTDCTGNFHYGYAYFVAASQPLSITVNYCAGDSVASLTAPDGFEQYQWVDRGGTIVDSARILTLANPAEGSVYSCGMTSETGCTVGLQSTIARYTLNLGYSSYMIDCKSNTVQFQNQSSCSHGSLVYRWDFGDGNTSAEREPRYTFSTSGLHRVKLAVMNPPSSCTDSLEKEIESFSPPLVGITGDTAYCRGEVTWLKAYGAVDYTWNNSSRADSIAVGDPGGPYWLIGRSSTGCVSDTIRVKVAEEPDWNLVRGGDTVLCSGGQALLKVSGARRYLWSTGDTAASVTVAGAGTYSVTGFNDRGCTRTISLTLPLRASPSAAFTLSTLTLDNRHNQLTGTADDPTAALYAWDTGDSLSESGPYLQHAYSVTPGTTAYTVRLTVTTASGCATSDSTTVDVTPFVPNVFTPNGDGINDRFMEGTRVQVFDRNGMPLYDGTDGWDGTSAGRPLPPDTYFYLVRFVDRYQAEQLRKGFIALIR